MDIAVRDTGRKVPPPPLLPFKYDSGSVPRALLSVYCVLYSSRCRFVRFVFN